jgi:hypothetical protein
MIEEERRALGGGLPGTAGEEWPDPAEDPILYLKEEQERAAREEKA